MNTSTPCDLSTFTTFAVKATTDHLVTVKNSDDILRFLQQESHAHPILVLGSGSNVLLTGHYPGWILHNQIKGIEIIKENNFHAWVKVGAGEIWHDLVMYSIEKNFSGIENLSLIPGTVGAAPIQNIGAYGVEFASVMHSLNAIDLITGEQVSLSNKTCEFGYRDSIFKNKAKDRYFIIDVTLKLHKHHQFNTSYQSLKQHLEQDPEPLSLKRISQAVIDIRNSKLPNPTRLPNAGSFFKNPHLSQQETDQLKKIDKNAPLFPSETACSKIPAAWLIDQCRLKGKIQNQVGTYEQQAVVIVNHGTPSGAQIAQFAKYVQRTVHSKFGIWLEPEVRII